MTGFHTKAFHSEAYVMGQLYHTMEVLIMRAILILVLTALVTLGCNKDDTEVTTELSERKAAGEQDMGVTRTENTKPELNTGGPAGESTIDPVIKDNEYPNSEVDGNFSMGNTVSVMYKSPDGFAKVVAFYNHKFSVERAVTGTSAYFVRHYPDGKNVTVTVTPFNNDITQIILKLDKKDQ